MDVSHGSPVDQINFSQLKAKLTGVVHCIGKRHLHPSWISTNTANPPNFSFVDDCRTDLPVLEVTSRSGLANPIELRSNPSKTNEMHFEEDHLLPGKYTGERLTKSAERRESVRLIRSDIGQIESE